MVNSIPFLDSRFVLVYPLADVSKLLPTTRATTRSRLQDAGCTTVQKTIRSAMRDSCPHCQAGSYTPVKASFALYLQRDGKVIVVT